jgi:hypothetical protein
MGILNTQLTARLGCARYFETITIENCSNLGWYYKVTQLSKVTKLSFRLLEPTVVAARTKLVARELSRPSKALVQLRYNG